MPKPVVVVAGLGDTGVLVATRLSRSCRVVAVTTRPALVSGQELGIRLTDPRGWSRHYFVPLDRFRRLDRVEVYHGRVTAVDVAESTVLLEHADGSTDRVRFDALVVATGVSNGFWRDDLVEGLDSIVSRLDQHAARLSSARIVAVVGGGATGVSVADNLARRGTADVHLFHSGEMPLPQHHPAVRRWVVRLLGRDGVTVHPGHRAVLPNGDVPRAITSGPVDWGSGQPSFDADAVVWAVGAVRPHSGFMPTGVLDDDGFVRVDRHLRVLGTTNVFAVGDVAASDPLRSSARNWGHRVVVANVRRVLRGAHPASVFRAPRYRWGSVIGLQREGLTIATASGWRVRVPRRLAAPLLYGVVVTRSLYGGLRPERADDRALRSRS
ncbi:MAG: FAD-dependent oxidoreductase [Ilumatobacteraceae bacterium]